jgi:hypothetical protein
MNIYFVQLKKTTLKAQSIIRAKQQQQQQQQDDTIKK